MATQVNLRGLLVQAISELKLRPGGDRAEALRLDQVDDFVEVAEAILREDSLPEHPDFGDIPAEEIWDVSGALDEWLGEHGHESDRLTANVQSFNRKLQEALLNDGRFSAEHP